MFMGVEVGAVDLQREVVVCDVLLVRSWNVRWGTRKEQGASSSR